MNTRQHGWYSRLLSGENIGFNSVTHTQYKQELEEVFDILRSKGYTIETILYSPVDNVAYKYPHYKATIPRRPQFHPNSTPNTTN